MVTECNVGRPQVAERIPSLVSAADNRGLRILPQAETHRTAGGLLDFLCAKNWGAAKEIVLRNPELPVRARQFLSELIKATTLEGKLDSALLLGDTLQLFQEILLRGLDKVEQIPNLCWERWQVPDAKPPAATVIDIMLLARPLVAVETAYFNIPNSESLDTAIEQWSKILQHRGFQQMPLGWRLDAFNSAGNCRMLRIYTTVSEVDLLAAEQLYQNAIAESPTNWANLPKYHHNFGRALFARYGHLSGDIADLNRAIQESEQAVALMPQNILFLSELGMLSNQRYVKNSSLADLDRAVALLEEAVRLSQTSPNELPTVLNLLGSALRNRFVIKRQAPDISRAVSVQRLSIEANSLDIENLPARLTNLGNSLLEKTNLSHSSDELAEAITVLARALELTSPTDPFYPSRLNNLANGLSVRYRVNGDLADLSQAIDLYRRAIRLTPSHEQQLASRFYNLANNLRGRWERSGTSEDESEGREAYANACVSGLRRDIHWAFFAARNWGEWASSRQSWHEAGEAYNYGLRVINELLGVQISQSSKVPWLSQLQGFSSAAAFVFYKNNDYPRAALALEQCRAYLMTEALQLNSLAVEGLHKLGRTDLVVRYENAVKEWSSIVNDPDPAWQGAQWKRVMEQVRSAKEELKEVVDAIRELPGYESFAASPSLSEIREAAKLSPLVYLAAAKTGGIAVLVPGTARQEIQAIALPGLNEDSLRQRFEEYHNSYFQREKDPKRWLSALDEMTRWLWEVCMSEVLKQLGNAPSAYLIPCGLLGLLPLHASWAVDQKESNKRLYAMEQLRLGYVPNARALLAAFHSDKFEGNTLLVISDPRPTSEPLLKYAQYETRAAASSFRQHKLLRHSKATCASVIALLPQYEAVHFACHAVAHTADTQRSGFILAEDDVLTIDALRHCRLMKTRLAVLSACETAVQGEELPDEVISLASVFLQTGVDAVIASLWAVLDASTMLLMTRFYQLWRKNNLSPGEALRQAQLWMLKAPDQEKARAVRGLIPKSIHRELEKTPSGVNHFAHPDHWAAFTYVGI
jgi:CHAT domain-containing protein/tetratricopeptide (TPR) repeat protein